MDREALERAHTRLAEAREQRPSRIDLEAAVERAESALDQLARTTAELEAVVPERLGAADVCAHEAGRNAVDTHPGRQLVCHLADEPHHGMLRGRVHHAAHAGVGR